LKKNKNKKFLFACDFEDIDKETKTEILLYLKELYKKCNVKEKKVFRLILQGYKSKEIRSIAKIDGYVYKEIIKKFKKFVETGIYG
jgi:flavorubredoxin